MAEYKIPYQGLQHSLKHLKIQIIDSLPFVVKNLPRFDTPEQIFNYCKSKFIYQNDPQGVELFQSVQTLLKNGGKGDCDCATIFCIAMLLVNGFTDCGIVLVGKRKHNATHIYAYTINKYNQKVFLDLTNKNFNQVRPYAFKQCVPFKISQNQLDMYLQLADGESQQTMLYRELSDNEKNEGIFIPSKNLYLPIDKADKIPQKSICNTMLSEGYEISQVNEYLGSRAQRKANKQTKFETKQANKQAKVKKKEATATKRISKGEAKVIRSTAKQTKAQQGGESNAMKIFNKGGELIKTIITNANTDEVEFDNQIPEFENQQEQQEQQEIEQQEIEQTELEDNNFNLGMKDFVFIGLFAVGVLAERKATKF